MPKKRRKPNVNLSSKSLSGKFSILLIYAACVTAILSISYLAFNYSYCKSSLRAHSSMGSFPVIKKNQVSLGYTLLTTYRVSQNGKATIYLVDLYGKPVHTWRMNHTPFYSILKKNGNLLVAIVTAGNDSNFPGGGRTGMIQELDWKSNVIWEYRNENLHHDIEVLPNGNVAALIWEKVPKNIAKDVKGGAPNTEFKGDIWSDAIIEIDKKGNIIWIWHAYEHFDSKTDILGPLTPRAEWTHANSLRYIDKDTFYNEPAYLISLREINTVALVKRKDGEFIWKSPKTMLAYQHDATLLPNGHVLVFDNNVFREPNPRPRQGSRVVEIDMIINTIVWKLDGGETGMEKARFKADITSGAQRLQNGNTLVINGPLGHLFEVTPQKQLVWDFMNPFGTNSTGPWPSTALFKARRYGVDEIDWPEELSPPLPALSSICQSIKKYI